MDCLTRNYRSWRQRQQGNKKVAKSGNGQIEARDQCNFIVIALNYEGRMPAFINSLFTKLFTWKCFLAESVLFNYLFQCLQNLIWIMYPSCNCESLSPCDWRYFISRHDKNLSLRLNSHHPALPLEGKMEPTLPPSVSLTWHQLLLTIMANGYSTDAEGSLWTDSFLLIGLLICTFSSPCRLFQPSFLKPFWVTGERPRLNIIIQYLAAALAYLTGGRRGRERVNKMVITFPSVIRV